MRDPRSSYGTPRTLHAAACNQADPQFRARADERVPPRVPRYSVASGGITLGPRVGQGTVRFASAEECRRALVNLNGHHMGNRYIELFFS